MRVVITGATGFIGKALCKELHKDYELIGLSRNAEKAAESLAGLATTIEWNARTVGGWEAAVEGAVAIVNLAGENIGTGRWTEAKKRRILQSRLNATRMVFEAVKQANNRPKVVIQASAIGYYGCCGDEIVDESRPAGDGFLADVCEQWEQTMEPIQSLGVRLATARFGTVLGAEGGLIRSVLPRFRYFPGFQPGSGKQWLSWVHIEDAVGGIRFLIENDTLQGTYNLTSPNPVLSKDFYQLLGKAAHCAAILHVPASVLKLLMGEMATELLLCSQRVLPEKLLQSGYKFRYAEIEPALEDICKITR